MRLAKRRPPPEVLERTVTFDLDSIRLEWDYLLARSDSDRIRALYRSGIRRARQMTSRGFGEATHIYSTFGEGGEFLYRAKEAGLTVVSDIIIALSADKIVADEWREFQDWGPQPVNVAAAVGGNYRPEQILLEATDVFLCPSQIVADDLTANWGVETRSTRLLPYAISEQWFAIEPEPKLGRVLFVGTADIRKGIHYFAQAADRLRARGRTYEFRVAGRVAPEVREKPVCWALEFLGRVPRARIAAEFSTADLFVLPTLAEGSATVIYEALAAGVPVVTTPAAGSVVRHGVDGLIVPVRDPDALADAIEHIIEDRQCRQRMAENARDEVAKYDWNHYQHAILDILATAA